jgi:hypothetical protein
MGATMADLDLYFLRVWRRAAGALGFRAAIKPLDGERAQVFSDPARLAAYLTERAAAPSPAAADPAAAPQRRG